MLKFFGWDLEQWAYVAAWGKRNRLKLPKTMNDIAELRLEWRLKGNFDPPVVEGLLRFTDDRKEIEGLFDFNAGQKILDIGTHYAYRIPVAS